MSATLQPWVRWGRWVLSGLIVLAVFGGLLRPSFGAIAAGTAVSKTGSAVSSMTWSHTIPSGNNRLLVVRVGWLNSNASVTGVTYGGVAMTSLSSAVNGTSTAQPAVAIYYLLAPTVGTASVKVSLDTAVDVAAVSLDFTGVSQTTPFGTAVSASGSTSPPSTTVSGLASDLFIDIASTRGSAGTSATAGTGQTGSYAATGSTSSDVLVMASTKAGAASSTLSWNYTTSTPPWISIGVPIHAAGVTISGTVFEDVNYGGGAGRNRSTALANGGTVRPNVRVELFTVSGTTATQVAATTTDASGNYSFPDRANGNYMLRVVSSTVRSGRSGNTASLIGVLTYRATAPSGTAIDVTDEVGGRGPSVTGLYNVQSNTGDQSSTAVSYAEGIADLTVSGGDVAGMDFGYNFDTVTNTNDSGQGSLRQAITNANTLGGDSSLAQSGRPAGVENLVFMISNGTTGSGGSLALSGGLRTANNYFSSGVATLSPASALPEVTGMVIDAQAQPGWTAAPIIELNGSGAGASINGLTARGGTTLRGLVINRFKANAVQFLDAGSNVIQGCYLGLNAAGTAASANTGIGVNVYNSPNNTIGGTGTSTGNVISGNGGIGVNLSGTGAGMVVQGNTIGLNAAGTARVANGSIGLLVASGSATIGGTGTTARNVIAGNTYENVQIGSAGSSSTVQGNYIGTDASGGTTITNGSDGLWLNGTSSVQVGGTTAGAGNLIAGNAGRGVNISGSGTGNTVRGNSIYGNSNIGIDLASDGVTANDGAVSTGQPNLLMDFPVLASATWASDQLQVVGYVGSAASQTSFASATVDLYKSDGNSTGYGAGKVWLGTVTADASGNFNARVTLPSTSTLSAGDKITATATDGSGNTSEFSLNLTVTAATAWQNGSFETGPAAGTYVTLGHGTTSITGWTVLADTVDYIGTYWTAAAGSTSLDMNGGAAGGIQQAYATTAGQTYTIVFAVATNPGCGSGTCTMTVSANGTLLKTVSLTGTGRSTSSMGWAYQSTSFVATSALSHITFQATSSGASGVALDDVRVGNAMLSGKVFEDANYGGGVGRSLATSSGSGQSGATVEVYDASGNYLGATSTDSSGNYSYPVTQSATYQLRVVNSSVRSSRTGWVSGLLPVQTFRTSASAGVVSAVTDRVGGENPALVDAAANGGSATLASLTTTSTTAQSVASIGVGTADVSGIDFGFNFSTVVNTNDSGQGSLRQFLTNAKTLGGQTSLAQSGNRQTSGSSQALPAGLETSIFMIPGGSAVGGIRSTVASQLTNGVAVLTVGSALPSLSNTYVSLDGTTQTVNVGNTNSLILGTGGTVGTAATALAQLPAPEVQLVGGNGYNGITLDGAYTQVRGIAAYGFAETLQVNAASNAVIEQNLLGTPARSYTDPGAGVRSLRNHIYFNSAVSGVTVSRNLIAYAGRSGVTSFGNGGVAVSSVTISGNEIRGNSAANTQYDGIGPSTGATGWTISNNLITANAGLGIDAGTTTGNGHTVSGNTISGNGTGAVELVGIFMAGSSQTLSNNVITGHPGSGITVVNSASVHITQNSLYGNNTNAVATRAAGISFSNDRVGTTVTANDGLKTASTPNQQMDYPVITAATTTSTTLTVSGYVGLSPGSAVFAGSTVEIFVSSNASSGYGEGQTYIGSLTADANGAFSGSLTLPGGVTLSAGSPLTGTATDGSGNTSEFGPNALVGLVISGTVFEDVNYGGGAGRSQAGSSGPGVSGARVELYNASGTFVSATTTSASGGYSFSGLSSSTAYFVRVVNSTVLSTRGGSSASLVPVMSYRTEAAAGTPAAVTNEVGGAKPAAVDASAGSSGTTLWTSCATENNTCSFSGTRTVRYGATSSSTSAWVTQVLTGGTACSNGVFGDPISGTVKACYLLNADYQSVSTVYIASASVSGADFGFNFDTVVNVNDTGQGSLRQAITNAKALTGDSSLAQAGRTAGIENLVFMVSNGTAGSGGSLSLTGGLRSSNNYLSSGVATITLASVLPTISTPMVIDAQAQPGWTANPVIDVNGASAGSVNGFTLSGGGSTLRGLVVRNFSGTYGGVYIPSGNGNTVQGCWLGLTAAGSAAAANSYGVYVLSASNTIGGVGAAKRNVISGNSGSGVVIWSGADSNTVQGNYIGLNATGTAAVGNVQDGIVIFGTNTTVGGVNAGEGNAIAGNNTGAVSSYAGLETVGSGTAVVRGNLFGLKADGSAAIASNGSGIIIAGAGSTVGGTASGAGNTITGHTLRGVAVNGSSTAGVAILGNSIYGNGGLGIDLASDGITANDGAKTASQPNLLMDFPVFTSASLSGTTLTVAGYVGSAAGQATFAGARVEVFISDATKTNGQGKTYLGFLTADASGNFSGTISTVSGVTNGTTRLTATATDASGNTSEFGVNFTVGLTVSGTVFEDANYGGGAGRSLATSAGGGVSGATVELYDSTGTYVTATTTASGSSAGAYSFGGLAAGNYFVRVASSTVLSQRSGSGNTLLGVLTYRTTAASGSAVAVTDSVGGTNPAVPDTGVGAAGTSFSTSTYVFSAGLAGTAHAVAPVTVGTGSIASVDFGFNFDTVVNTNASGQGSLYQAITNANQLTGDSSLAQAGRTAGIENLVFMISNGTTGAGLRGAYSYFSGGVATITPAAALPTISSPLVLDAQTQPGWTANPVIELNGTGSGNNNGLVLNAAGSIARGFIVNRWAYAGIRVTADATVQGNWLGTSSTGLAASANGQQGLELNGGAATVGGTGSNQGNVISGNSGAGIWISGGTGHVIQGNLIGLGVDGSTRVANTGFSGIEAYGSGSNTIGGTATGAGNTISGQTGSGKSGIFLCSNGNSVLGNRIGTNATGTAAVSNAGAGVSLCSNITGSVIGGTASGAGNLISGNGSHGIDAAASATVQGNTIGTNAAGTSAIANGSHGVYISGSSVTVTVGGTASGAANLISGNTGKGVVVAGNQTGNAIQRNRVYGNGGIAIDLGNDGVTVNDGAKTAAAANLLMDSPVFTAARATGAQLVVAGYVGSAAGQTTFASATVEIYASDSSASGYGGGKTYLGTVTTDANGNFSATLTMPAAVAIGTKLTGTATDGSGNTSEFGANFSGLIVDLVVNDNGDAADASPGDGYCATAGGVCTLRAAIAELNAWSSLATPPTIAFAIPGCTAYGAAACTITPASALPAISQRVLLDGSTQAGFSSSSYRPIIELSGAGAPAGTTGLVVSANNSTVRGLAINRFGGNGITLSGSGNTLAGLRIGLAVNAAATAANGGAGVYVSGSGALIGTTVGGVAAADANVIAGNTGPGVTLAAGTATLTGNFIGTDSGGTSGLGNGSHGVSVGTAGVTGISLAGNTIANNGGNGVGITSGSGTQVQVLGNSISGNGTSSGIGIDLGNNGVTANTGVTDSSKANNGMNVPVITGAGVGSTALTVYGYIGTGTGQAAFAGARVEFFKALADSSGYGQGQVYLGFLTADSNGRFSGSVTFPVGSLAVGDAITATATDTNASPNGNTSEFGPNRTSTSVAALTPGSFNAFDAATAANALTGNITSKTAGSAAPFAVIALDNSGTALHPGFTGSVTLTWVDARDDSGALSGSCRASWVDKGAAGTASFSNNNRVTVTLTPPASATRAMRLKMSYTANGSTTTACSNDAYAALPASLAWINASDADSATAGTTRVLANTGASGGVVHKAGRPFTVRAQALDATGALMTGYDGSPVLAASGCLLPSACTAATLTAATVSAVAGAYTHNTVSYAEVGALQVQLTDTSYANVDASDTALSVRTLTSASLSVGRFVPDAYTVAVSTSGQLATANGACMAAGTGATFMGQPFGWATTPQVTVTAVNAAGATTARWTGSLMKLTSGSGLVDALVASATGTATLSATYGSVAVSDLGSGQARLTASSSDRFLLDVSAGAVQDSVTPTWAWSLALTDSSEAGVSGNPTLTATASQGGLAFNSGSVFHTARLSLSPAYGDVRVGIKALVQLQRYTAAGWVTLTDEQGCVTIQNQNVAVESPSGVFATLGGCAAPMGGAVTTKGGRAWLAFPGTPAGTPGRLTLRLAGAAATGGSCTTAGAAAALVSLAPTWLLGGSSGTGPAALATWGKPQRDAVLRRETW